MSCTFLQDWPKDTSWGTRISHCRIVSFPQNPSLLPFNVTFAIILNIRVWFWWHWIKGHSKVRLVSVHLHGCMKTGQIQLFLDYWSSWREAQKHEPCLELSVLPLSNMQFLSHSNSLEMRSKVLQNGPLPMASQLKLGSPWDVHISWSNFTSLFTNCQNKWQSIYDIGLGASAEQWDTAWRQYQKVTGTRKKAWPSVQVRWWNSLLVCTELEYSFLFWQLWGIHMQAGDSISVLKDLLFCLELWWYKCELRKYILRNDIHTHQDGYNKIKEN